MSAVQFIAVAIATAIAAIVLALIDRHDRQPPIETHRLDPEQRERLRRRVEEAKRRRQQGRPPWH